MIESKECFSIVCDEQQRPESTEDGSAAGEVLNAQKSFDKRKRKATAIQITAPCDKPLKLVQKYSEILEEL